MATKEELTFSKVVSYIRIWEIGELALSSELLLICASVWIPALRSRLRRGGNSFVYFQKVLRLSCLVRIIMHSGNQTISAVRLHHCEERSDEAIQMTLLQMHSVNTD